MPYQFVNYFLSFLSSCFLFLTLVSLLSSYYFNPVRKDGVICVIIYLETHNTHTHTHTHVSPKPGCPKEEGVYPDATQLSVFVWLVVMLERGVNGPNLGMEALKEQLLHGGDIWGVRGIFF